VLSVPARGRRAPAPLLGLSPLATRGLSLLCAAFLQAALLFALPAPAPAADAAAFDGNGMWIYVLGRSNGGDVDSIAADAHARGVSTLVVKAGDGTRYWSQFSPELVSALHERGLRVCGYSRLFGGSPKTEARVSARAVTEAGADCFVIDAEAEYEGRYKEARTYMRVLRKLVGPDYPLGFTSFPYVDLHRSLPYSVFLGPGGAQFNLPQIYWRAIGDTVDESFARTYAWNSLYGRPIRPVGQVWMNPPAAEVLRFRELAAAYGSPAVSWWSWQAAGPAALSGLTAPLNALAGAAPVTPPVMRPTVRRGARGDVVRWAQMHLGVPVTGYFGVDTKRAVRAFQGAHGLVKTSAVDPPTWAALVGPG
jgi:hypothetical protein